MAEKDSKSQPREAPEEAVGGHQEPADDAAAAAEPRERVFRLRHAVDVASEGVHRVCLGANPRISLGKGETFATADLRLADRLAANPDLEEVQA